MPTIPTGSLPISDSDPLASRFLMLVEGECLDDNVAAIAQKYGYCRQRYYQILHAFQQGGLPALQPQKTGPKSNYRRTDQAVRQILEGSPGQFDPFLLRTFSNCEHDFERIFREVGD